MTACGQCQYRYSGNDESNPHGDLPSLEVARCSDPDRSGKCLQNRVLWFRSAGLNIGSNRKRPQALRPPPVPALNTLRNPLQEWPVRRIARPRGALVQPAAVVAEITRALHAGRAGGTVWFAVLSGWAGIARCRSLAARITSSARSRRCRAPASSVRIATSHRRRQQLPHPSSDPVPVMPTLPETVVRGRRPPGEPAADPAPATASVNTARLKACPKSV